MIDFMVFKENSWTPDPLDPPVDASCIEESKASDSCDYLAILQTEPFIEAVYVHRPLSSSDREDNRRFVFHEGYAWDIEDEQFFIARCLKNPRIDFTHSAIDPIFKYYSKHYPDWKLQRYYTRPMRLLDHIYNCMQQGTGKEILYKASLDELAENIDTIDELNLLSSKPLDIYDGVPMRVLRALNCHAGAELLSKSSYRRYLIDLNMRFPDTFKERLNDAQCMYLRHLIDGDLTVGETGRLFKARRSDLMRIWIPAQYELFLNKETIGQEALNKAKELAKVDPVYKKYVDNFDDFDEYDLSRQLRKLSHYLLENEDDYSRKIRRSNRKRNADWQERNHGYVVRYPQTANDFCREAVYMSNCLLSYMEAIVHNDTTVLFIRQEEDVNRPFITMEAQNGELYQAYRRFNDDCTPEEADWIRAYCDRHDIGHSKFHFDKEQDQLF